MLDAGIPSPGTSVRRRRSPVTDSCVQSVIQHFSSSELYARLHVPKYGPSIAEDLILKNFIFNSDHT